jgi:glycine/D-amino acid oxidase-like deaminating enzyme
VIRLADGESVAVDRVLVAAGAGSRELVDVELDVTGEVVVDAPVLDAVGAKLTGLPCIGRLSAESIVEGYLTSPIRGAEEWSIKFGAELPEIATLGSASDVAAWMAGDAHEERLPEMASALGELLPGLRFGLMRSRPCIYTRTPSGLPIVDELEQGLFIATGGNGRMAKSADAVAALATTLALEGEWDDDDFDASLFAR